MRIGKERLRLILDRHGVTFQRTKTWKESNDPHKEAKLDRIEEVLQEHPDRVFAFDEFRPLAMHPVGRLLLGDTYNPSDCGATTTSTTPRSTCVQQLGRHERKGADMT